MGRPLSRPGLGSTTRRELCWWLAQGHSKEEAAKKAGLPDTYRLHAFARTREFADELRSAMLDHMGTNLAPKAVRILDEIMTDKNVQPRVRVDAAKALLDRAGYTTIDAPKRSLDPKDLASVSYAELEQIAVAGKLVSKEQDRRAEGAKVVEPSLVEAMLS